MDPQLLLFRRQYLQLFEPDFLSWPPKQLLRKADAQAWLYKTCFDSDRNTYLPTERYQYRVLKVLVGKMEQSIEDPEEDEISDALLSHLSALVSSDLPTELSALQQRSYVTFSIPIASSDPNPTDSPEPAITLLERRNLISGSLTTGFRTWEAAMHLGAYLLTPPVRSLINGKNVLELGAGTGFVSILCAKQLGAKHVTATDGDEAVIEALKENFFLNGLDDAESVNASVLRWGRGLRGTWVADECEIWPYDVVVGCDITYEKFSISALVTTLRYLFELRPNLLVLISSAIRNAETFQHFQQACQRHHFVINEVPFEATPIRQQTSLFYAVAVPLKILSLTRSSEVKAPR